MEEVCHLICVFKMEFHFDLVQCPESQSEEVRPNQDLNGKQDLKNRGDPEEEATGRNPAEMTSIMDNTEHI